MKTSFRETIRIYIRRMASLALPRKEVAQVTQQSPPHNTDDVLPFTPHADDSVIRKDQMDQILEQVRQDPCRDIRFNQRVQEIKQTCRQAIDSNAGRS